MTGNYVLGIAGTAKNTGKTTVLSALLEEIEKQRPGAPPPALTSIGYDGENFDNVTGLPKPRIKVSEDQLLAVAERCLYSGGATVETLQTTNIQTPLGKIVLGRVTRPGRIILAGPNNRRDLARVLDLFSALGANLTIVDGALSRIAPLVLARGLILCTGAARNPDPRALASETRAVVEILRTAPLVGRGRVAGLKSVFNQAGFESLIEALPWADTILIDGLLSGQYYSGLADRAGLWAGKRLIFTDPVKLLLSGEPERTRRLIQILTEGGAEVGVAEPGRLAAVTVNPYYPKYRYDRKDYEVGYVDPDQLRRLVAESLSVPCFDVVRQGPGPIYEELSRDPAFSDC